MKKTFLISLLAFAALSVNAQSADNSYTNSKGAVCKKFQNMPAGATPVWPKGAYTPMEDPSCAPCYEYKSKKTGVMIMECPYLQVPAEHNSTADISQTDADQLTSDRSANLQGRDVYTEEQTQNSYTGNYPACKKFPDMPAGAKPVWPKGVYTPLEAQACPPCYEYKSKKTGIMIMECPYLRFPAEHN